MSTFKTVAVAGANGSLGGPVVKRLLEAGFEVTALVRSAGKTEKKPNLTEAVVDFEDQASLAKALKGIDVVVSTIGSTSLKAQIVLVEAAVEAGVKRFLPSDFGSDLENPETRGLPVYADKVQIQELLKAKAKETHLTYTVVQNNAFLDWGLTHKFIFDPVEHKATFWDGGDFPITLTRLSTVGLGVVGVLKHPEETKNRVVYISEVSASIRKLVKITQELAPGKEWTTNVASTAEARDQALEGVRQGKFGEFFVFVNQIFRAAFAKDTGTHFVKNDNELLGIKELNDEELKEAIKETLQTIPGAL